MTLLGLRGTLPFNSPTVLQSPPSRLFPSSSSTVLLRCLNHSTKEAVGGVTDSKNHIFNGTVPKGSPKLRLDAWLAAQLPDISRARIQSSVRQGFVQVNGDSIQKISHTIRAGDTVSCKVAPLTPLRAEPEDISLDLIYEDNHVIIVNKPPHMVVHPAPGNAQGTLVNGILHHCGLSSVACSSIPNDLDIDDDSDNENQLFVSNITSLNTEASVRPGIVHRLDKGTSGLLVVAKNEHAHAHLAGQFERHTVFRRYMSLTCGVPPKSSGRIEIPIARDTNNRIRMAAVPNPSGNRRSRFAASRYTVIEEVGGGGVGLVEWQLETGRTHQIRVHSQYLGFPLLGDDTYGGTKGLALSRLKPKLDSKYHRIITELLSGLQRPCLHAFSLGFEHPHSGKFIKFSCPPPHDFLDILEKLQNIQPIGSSRSIWQDYLGLKVDLILQHAKRQKRQAQNWIRRMIS